MQVPINSELKLLFRLKCGKRKHLSQPTFCTVSVQGTFFVFWLNTLFLKFETDNDLKHFRITFNNNYILKALIGKFRSFKCKVGYFTHVYLCIANDVLVI